MPESLQVTDGWVSELQSAGLESLAEVFAWNVGERLDKPGLEDWRQRWRVHLEDAQGSPRTLYLKRFDRPPLRRQWERWQSAPRLSTAGIEWRNACDLARAGIRAAQAVAFGQQMIGPIEIRSAVMLGEVPGVSLEKWVPANLPPAHADEDLVNRRRRLDSLARFIARFHAAGFVHRDLYLCHVFFDAAAPDTGLNAAADEGGGSSRDAGFQRSGGEAFCLIDLQRVFRPRWRRRRWIVKDLAALDFSTPADRVDGRERLRFLCRYVRHCPGFGSARLLAGRIAARNARMARRVRSGM
jgi:hypothetical protein